MSQVATKKRLKIRNERVRVTGHFHEHGSVLKGDAEGFCDGFEVEISIDTEEQPDEILTLIRLARQMCFTEKALTGSIAVTVVQKVNGLVMEM
ncbi:MAG: OsmC family protein [Anaerolineaceae bacterium]|nr:OsmC family protein [Anaerolineaceae bacterium]